MDGMVQELFEIAPKAKLIGASGNVGFAAGANLGAAAAKGELIVLLNPDAVVEPGWAEAMRAPWGQGRSIWMALVTMDGGETINTSGGVLHFSGIGWAGQAGDGVSLAPRQPAPVGFASGACLAISAADWRRVDGFSPWYFMYCEDVDLSLRIRLLGGTVAVIPAAKVVHDYRFHKGSTKWRMLERNRWATIIRCYPAPLLGLLLPALIAAEFAVWLAAIHGRWGAMKALAVMDVLRAFPRLIAERRDIQSQRTITAAEFSAALTADLSSSYLDAAALQPVAPVLRIYWSLVRKILAARGSRQPRPL